MATHASALKRARQSEARRRRNAVTKSTLRTSAKKVLAAVEAKKPQEAKKALAEAVPIIQKASSRGVMHRKNAARKISRLARKVNGLS